MISAHLDNQSPQVAAYYLDRLGGERASALLKSLPVARRNDLLNRMLGMGQVSPLVVEALESGLHDELFEVDHRSSDKYVSLAGILNNMDKDEAAQALEYLTSVKPKDAEAIRKMLFKFEDLQRLQPRALTVLMDGIPVERTVLCASRRRPRAAKQSAVGAGAARPGAWRKPNCKARRTFRSVILPTLVAP